MKKEYLIKKMIKIIKENPGIRPLEINKKLKVEHSWNLRKALINKKYIKKIKKGNAVYYYSVKQLIKMKEDISWFENLFYGYRSFGDYDSGMNIEYILPEIHKRYFGVCYTELDIKEKQKQISINH